MSSPPTSTPDDNFNARLDRVAEARAPIDAAKTYVPPVPDWKENLKYPAAIIGAVLVGMLAVLLSRYVRYQLLGTGLAGEDPDIAMVIDGALAGACSFLLFGMMRFDGAEFKAAQTVGIIGMICAMHNFVHIAPSPFKAAFSTKWTEDVLASSEPNSLLFRGAYFVLYEPKQENAKKPIVRRAGKS